MRNYGLVSKIIYCPIFVRFPAKKQAVSEAFAISRQKKKPRTPLGYWTLSCLVGEDEIIRNLVLLCSRRYCQHVQLLTTSPFLLEIIAIYTIRYITPRVSAISNRSLDFISLRGYFHHSIKLSQSSLAQEKRHPSGYRGMPPICSSIKSKSV